MADSGGAGQGGGAECRLSAASKAPRVPEMYTDGEDLSLAPQTGLAARSETLAALWRRAGRGGDATRRQGEGTGRLVCHNT